MDNIFQILTIRGFDVTLLHPANTLEKNLLSATKSVEWNVFLGLVKPNPLNLLTKTHSLKNDTPKSPFQIRKKSTLSNESVKSSPSVTLSPITPYQDQSSSNFTTNNIHENILSPQPINYQPISDYYPYQVEYGSNMMQQVDPNYQYNNFVEYNNNQMKYNYPSQFDSNSGEKLQIMAKFAPLLETIRLLQRPDKPQVLLSMLGGRCDWKNMGYSKLRDYILDAYQHGLCLFGGNPPQEFVYKK